MSKKHFGTALISSLLLTASGVSCFASDGGDLSGNGLTYVTIIAAAAIIAFAAIAVAIIVTSKRAKYYSTGNSYISTLGDRRSLRAYYDGINAADAQKYALAYIAFNAKKIDDRYGHDYCERLQTGAAEIIAENLGENDRAAYLKSGVFAVCLNTQPTQAERVIVALTDELNRYQARILSSVFAPFKTGIYICDGEKIRFDAAILNAKLGYAYACDNSFNTYVCTKELLRNETYKTHLKNKLSRAIDAGQFDPFMQFIYNAEKGKFTNAEILSRWNNPEEGFLMPAYYINDMRSTGVIEKFDMYMLDKTCSMLDSWRNTEFADLTLSCNITRITISSQEFMHKFLATAKKYDFDHSRLILEITEDALMDNKETAYSNIVECRKNGFKIAIDDFCTGNSSLDDLGSYPMDQIKLDRRTSSNVKNERSAELLRGIVDIAHNLSIEVVCEGIETKAQRDTMLEVGCDLVQGYLYSYVFPIEEGKAYYLKSLSEPVVAE